jgi:ATP-dependent Clp protease adaptor protein ClpS
MSLDASFDEFTQILKDENILTAENSKLVVYNDDFNTFDWVIECFMQVCNHTFEQSEQLSLMVHFKGKAVVKTAPFDVLKPMKDALVDRGLSAVIESLVND